MASRIFIPEYEAEALCLSDSFKSFGPNSSGRHAQRAVKSLGIATDLLHTEGEIDVVEPRECGVATLGGVKVGLYNYNDEWHVDLTLTEELQLYNLI